MFDAGAIVGRLKLKADDFNSGVNNAKKNVRELGEEMKRTGKAVSELGSRLLQISAAILGPLAFAVANSSKRNLELSQSIRSVKSSMEEMVDTIVPSLVPWMNRLAELVRDLAGFLNALPRAVRDNVINFLVMAGVITLVSGLILKLAGNLIRLAAVLITPFGIVTALVGVLTYLIFTNKKVAESFLNTFEFVFRFLKKGFLETRVILTNFAVDVVKSLETVVRALASVPGPLQSMYTKAANSLINLRTEMQLLATRDMAEINEQIREMGNLMEGGPGEWATGWEEFKQSIFGVGQEMSKLKNKFATEFVGGIKSGLDELRVKFNDFRALGVQVITDLVQNVQTLFSDLFFNVLSGQLKGFKAIFAEFGRSLLRMLSQVIAQLIIAAILKSIVLGGAAAPIKAVSSFALPKGSFADGTESVKETGLYKLHAGEEVVQRSGPKGGSGGTIELTMYNLLTNEVIAQAIRSREGEGAVVNIIDLNSARGGAVRRTIKGA